MPVKTEKRKTFLIHFAYLAAILVMVVLGAIYLLPPLTPFIIAFVIAWLLRAPIAFFSRKLHVPQKLTAVVVVLLFYGLMGLLLALIGIRSLSGLSRLVQSMPELYSSYIQPMIWDVLLKVETVILRMDASLMYALEGMGAQLVQSLGQMVSDLSVKLMGAVSGFATSLPGLFIDLVVMIISSPTSNRSFRSTGGTPVARVFS